MTLLILIICVTFYQILKNNNNNQTVNQNQKLDLKPKHKFPNMNVNLLQSRPQHVLSTT